MLIGDARGFNFARVADDNFRPFIFGLNHATRHDGVRIRAVVAKDQQATGIFNIADAVAHRAVTQHFLQPGNRWAVAHAGAAIDVIGMQHAAGEFLHHIVGFITGTAR